MSSVTAAASRGLFPGHTTPRAGVPSPLPPCPVLPLCSSLPSADSSRVQLPFLCDSNILIVQLQALLFSFITRAFKLIQYFSGGASVWHNPSHGSQGFVWEDLSQEQLPEFLKCPKRAPGTEPILKQWDRTQQILSCSVPGDEREFPLPAGCHRIHMES